MTVDRDCIMNECLGHCSKYEYLYQCLSYDLSYVKYHCMKISNVEKCDVKEMTYQWDIICHKKNLSSCNEAYRTM